MSDPGEGSEEIAVAQTLLVDVARVNGMVVVLALDEEIAGEVLVVRVLEPVVLDVIEGGSEVVGQSHDALEGLRRRLLSDLVEEVAPLALVGPEEPLAHPGQNQCELDVVQVGDDGVELRRIEALEDVGDGAVIGAPETAELVPDFLGCFLDYVRIGLGSIPLVRVVGISGGVSVSSVPVFRVGIGGAHLVSATLVAFGDRDTVAALAPRYGTDGVLHLVDHGCADV